MKSTLIFAAGALAGAASLFYALQNDLATPAVAVITQAAPSEYVPSAPAAVTPSEQEPDAMPVAPAMAQVASVITTRTTSAETMPIEMPLAPTSEPPADSPVAPEPGMLPPSTEEASVQTMPAEPSQVHPGALLIPVTGIVSAQLSDTFNDKRGTDRIHEALDIMAPLKTPVVAVDDGKVVKLFTSVPGGLTVYQYDASGTFAYYYAHLDSYAADLEEGQEFKRGDLLGYVGATGNANPLAPHLHFAIFLLGPEKQWWKGTAINPYPLFQR
ncbi:peptidoglycan DD-metalloendopeptidase family protein [Pseudomonas sp. MMS21-TM103]|uniref:M23 family metallopeptidase n=1 Tax=unclassified Pseudomonas TaxID=196821 RepID=UPI001EDCEDAD|nr:MULTISPECIES: M23 family metallopeptidase [unclassified Pseudomonas]MCG4454329.1 peptidoglycan DD-metalloendopeptidase family protein [Pseudomonas sp. MMS21 TM103]